MLQFYTFQFLLTIVSITLHIVFIKIEVSCFLFQQMSRVLQSGDQIQFSPLLREKIGVLWGPINLCVNFILRWSCDTQGAPLFRIYGNNFKQEMSLCVKQFSNCIPMYFKKWRPGINYRIQYFSKTNMIFGPLNFHSPHPNQVLGLQTISTIRQGKKKRKCEVMQEMHKSISSIRNILMSLKYHFQKDTGCFMCEQIISVLNESPFPPFLPLYVLTLYIPQLFNPSPTSMINVGFCYGHFGMESVPDPFSIQKHKVIQLMSG